MSRLRFILLFSKSARWISAVIVVLAFFFIIFIKNWTDKLDPKWNPELPMEWYLGSTISVILFVLALLAIIHLSIRASHGERESKHRL